MRGRRRIGAWHEREWAPWLRGNALRCVHSSGQLDVSGGVPTVLLCAGVPSSRTPQRAYPLHQTPVLGTAVVRGSIRTWRHRLPLSPSHPLGRKRKRWRRRAAVAVAQPVSDAYGSSSRTRNSEPLSGLLFRSIRPLCARTMARTIAKPKPLPRLL